MADQPETEDMQPFSIFLVDEQPIRFDVEFATMMEFALESVVAEPWRESIAGTQLVQHLRKSLCISAFREVMLHVSSKCLGT